MGHNIKNIFLIYILAIFIRVWLMNSDYQEKVANLIELTTPLNSMKKVMEGIFRESKDLNAYVSNGLHVNPVHLKFYLGIMYYFGEYLKYVFIILDIITGHILYLFAKRFMLNTFMRQTMDEVISDDKMLLKGKDFVMAPVYVVCAYFFNPYLILNCAGMTLTVVHNLLLATFFVGLVYRNFFLSALVLALIVTDSLYGIILISPLYLVAYGYKKSYYDGFRTVWMVLFTCWYILRCSKHIYGDWSFLEYTIGFILNVPDQTPNIGIFWYFFMEIFNHFRALFICTFQLNVCFLYFVPFTIKFRKEPELLAMYFVLLISIFKSYPCLGDFGFALALLPCWKHYYNFLQNAFVCGLLLVITTALMPIFWHLWIYSNSGNANFYFGATLAFITGNIYLLSDICLAYSKRDYLIQNGNVTKNKNKNARLALQYE